MPDTAAGILAPPDPTTTPPPAAPLPATISAPAPSMPPVEMQPVQPSEPTSIPMAPSTDYSPGERQYHESWWKKVLDNVGTILGGDQTYKITKAPDGTMTASYEPSTTGEKWGRVAMAALGGAAQGAANSQGPGGLARGAAAGTQFGLKQPQQIREDVDQQVLHQAQMVKLNQDNVINAWNYKNLPQKYADEQAERTLQHAKTLDEMGAESIAMNVTNHDQLVKRGIADPSAVTAHMEGNMFVEPNGKGGVNFWKIPPSAANQRTTEPTKWYSLSLDPDDPTKTVKEEHVAPAGEKYLDYFKRTMGQQAANDKITSEAYRNEKAKTKDEREKQPTTEDAAIIAKYNKLYPNDPVKALDLATKEIHQGKKELRSITTINNQPASAESLSNWGTVLADPRSGVTLANVPPKQRDQVLNAMAAAGQKIAKPLTGEELKRSDLAYNALSNIERGQEILARRPDMFGPAGYGKTKFQQFLKGGDPDAMAYQTAMDLGNLPTIGIHGVRGKWALEDLGKLDSNLYNNRQSMEAVLNELHRSVSEFTKTGGRVLDTSGAPAAAAGTNTSQAARQPAAATPPPFKASPAQPPNPPFQGAVFGTGPNGTGWYPPSAAGGTK